MKILGLEFSSSQRSVAVVETAGPVDQSPSGPNIQAVEVIETGPGTTDPLGMIDSALRRATAEREQIAYVAVGLGPGSYNGIRLAIALAQGWQLARGIECVKLLGVSSAECIAAQARVEGLTGHVLIVMDAQRKEFYTARYEIDSRGYREIESLRLANLEQVQQAEQSSARLIGPEVTRWFKSVHVIFPRAATLAQLAAERTVFVSGERLEPIYLRETKFVKAPPPRQW